jgi:hypothetical protein
VTPSTPSRTVAATRPQPASPIAGTAAIPSDPSRKYDAAPTIATSAHATPIGFNEGPASRSSTSTSPAAQIAAPISVIGEGRSPRRSQSHATTAAGAVNSISSAGPTAIFETAEK